MTDYNDLITRLRSMDGIGDIQLNELMNRKTPMAAAGAIAELVDRVAYLESRLEVTPEHDIDGIAARDATIKLQDGRIAELEANRADLAKQALVAWDSGEEWEPLAFCLCAEENGLDSCHELIWEGYPPEPWGERWQKYEREAKRMIDLVSQYAALPVAASVRLTDAELEADRNTWRDKYMTQAGQLDLLKEAATFLASERAERERQEPVAWYIDGEDGREYNGTPKMSDGRIGTPLYAAPPVITQHEPVTTVEDRYNADGKSCHITDDLPAGMPLYAASPVAAPVRLTDSDVADLFRAWHTTDGASYADLILSVETAVLRANGFKLEGEQ